MTNFFDQLEKIIRDLDALESYDISETYYGDNFREQNKYAVHLENLLIAVTHEMATELAYMKEDIQETMRYIEFRTRYNYLTEEELYIIIDQQTLDLGFKLLLKKKLQDNYLQGIKNIQDDWRKNFSTLLFDKVRKKVK